MNSTQPGENPEVLADRYWRSVCALASCHLLGTTWPPPGVPQRGRLVGHWGCNPGIGWITAHLASHWSSEQPLLMVVGTGHASSFVFAHNALQTRADPAAITAAAARYGQPHGDPAELVGQPNVPYLGGELGPALAVSQGLAAAGAAPLVACVIGDAECETPAALAAFAHADVLLERGTIAWLPVINANGFGMGGPAHFTAEKLQRILDGFGYEVFCSNDTLASASRAARAAVTAAGQGRRVVWVSVTEKGWPAPEFVDGERYRGAAAHRAPPGWRAAGPDASALSQWFDAIGLAGLFSGEGLLDEQVAQLARRVVFDVPGSPAAQPAQVPEDAADAVSRAVRPGWCAPVTAVDEQLAACGALVLSPDEALSNRLTRCAAAGQLVEVLSEETCAAWAWGSVEAGRPAVFATYEAFAPLAGSVVAQYAKMLVARPARAIPALVVLATSLSWANSPTHQNTDLTGILAARGLPHVSVVYPVGAQSAARRIAAIARARVNGVALVLCSKQRLLDPPDPGGAVVRYRVTGAPPAQALVIAVGDVCVTEALAAAAIAADAGVGVAVIAVVELSAAAQPLARAAAFEGAVPTVAVACCAPDYVAGVLWGALQRFFPVHGYRERWGATAWETLRANRLDRVSVLEDLAGQGVVIAPAVIERAARIVGDGLCVGADLAGVIDFAVPLIEIYGGGVDGGRA